MKKQKKLLAMLAALVLAATSLTTQATDFGGNQATTAFAAEKASMTKILSLYKSKKYSQAKKMCKKLPKKASEKCVKKMSKNMKKAYLAKVKKYKTFSKVDITSGQEYIWGYYLTDFTNNGKAELIIKHGSCEADVRCTVYKYAKGKAVKIGTMYSGHMDLYAYPKHQGVIGVQGHMGGESLIKYYVKKSKIKASNVGGRVIKDGDDYMDLPYLLDNHVPSGKTDVSYKALK